MIVYRRTGRFSAVYLHHANAFCYELRRGIRIPFTKRLFVSLRCVGTYSSFADAVKALSLSEWRTQGNKEKE